MATTPNGWPVIEGSGCDLLVVAGISIMRGIRRGDVWVVMKWVAEQFHARVEPLRSPGCWGYNKRFVAGTTTWSEHAGGAAMDLNAPQHNMGDDPTPGPGGGYTVAQVVEIHQIEAETEGAVIWGGDFINNPDGMHFEASSNHAAVARFADKIRSGEDDMEPGDVWNKVKWGGQSASEVLIEIRDSTRVLKDRPEVDVDALAGRITPALVAAVNSSGAVTGQQVKDIVTEALNNTKLTVEG